MEECLGMYIFYEKLKCFSITGSMPFQLSHRDFCMGNRLCQGTLMPYIVHITVSITIFGIQKLTWL